MKKLLALLSVVLIAVSCSDNIDSSINVDFGEGAVRLGVVTRTAESSEIDTPVVIKIYKVEGEEQKLIRRYNSVNDVPTYLALLAGDYVAKVQVGEKQAVSFKNKYYYGESEFSVVAGEVEQVTVDCKLQSTIVSVVYDDTVSEKLSEGYFTTVAIAESYDEDAIDSGDVLSLTYTETKNGYVIMPEGQTSLYWHFEGTHPDEGDIMKEALIEDVKPSTKYTITFKYSKDAPGNLVFEATVDESIEEKDDVLFFSPDPVVLGDGFEISEQQLSITESRTYNITSLAAIDVMNVTIDDKTYNLLSDAVSSVSVAEGTEGNTVNPKPAGITVTKTDDMTYKVIVAKEFFAGVSGGEQTLSFYIEDVDGGKVTKNIVYKVQGILPLTAADYDLWNGTAKFKAEVLNTEASVVIAYSVDGGEWTEEIPKVGEDGKYTVVIDDFSVSKTYAYKLVVNNVDAGKSLSMTAPAGTQIPNGDMERWSKPTWWLPYGDGDDDKPFWLTGNEGGNMAGATLTQPSTDVRPGSAGSKSAYLKSQKATVMGIGKFAAGNLFTGTFAMNGLDGIVTFGRDFGFTAKPKSLSFWMKNNEGTINEGSKASGTDIYTAMILITDGTTYSVNTKDESTFLKMDDLATKPGVIAYGFIQSSDSHAEWTEKTIELTYREDMKNVKPKKIVVSFTPSGYGDYFCGSTSSWMYVDDIVLNY